MPGEEGDAPGEHAPVVLQGPVPAAEHDPQQRRVRRAARQGQG
jgi:hypothetical protein